MTPSTAPESDEIDLRLLFQTLWLHRKVIFQFALVCALIGVLNAQLNTKYVAEGVLQTGQINASNYKRYESVLLTGANLEKFLARNKQVNKDTAELVDELSFSAARLKDAIKPEFAFTDKDQKSLGVNLLPATAAP